MTNRKTRVLWTLDALENQPRMQAGVVEALRHLASRGPLEIEPLAILSEEEIKWVTDDREEVPMLVPADIEDTLHSWLGTVKIEGVLPLTVIRRKSLTPESAAEIVAERARASGVELIAAGTHAREGMERWMLGSFTESLVARSRIPVLVLNPHARVSGMGKILFATDFSPSARKAFETTVRFAAGNHGTLTLLHQAPPSERPATIDTPDDTGAAKNLAALWASWARHEGVATEVHIGKKQGDVGREIVEYAKASGTELIVVATHAGPIRTALQGSVTRAVLRAAECPVVAWSP